MARSAAVRSMAAWPTDLYRPRSARVPDAPAAPFLVEPSVEVQPLEYELGRRCDPGRRLAGSEFDGADDSRGSLGATQRPQPTVSSAEPGRQVPHADEALGERHGEVSRTYGVPPCHRIEPGSKGRAGLSLSSEIEDRIDSTSARSAGFVR